MKTAFLASAVALAVTAAHAEPSLFGVELGSSVSQLPACEYRATVTALCRERAETPGFVKVQFPTNSMPRFASERGWLELDGDAIVRVTVTTGGVSSQDSALAALISKWGKPAAVKRVPMQNSMGARFSSLQASWKIAGGFEAELNGMIGGEIDTGSIVLASPRALEIDRLQAAERAAKQRKP